MLNVAFQASIEVLRAHDGIDDSDNNQDHGDNGENSQRFPHWDVVCHFGSVVHAHQFEDEVGDSAEVKELPPLINIVNRMSHEYSR